MLADFLDKRYELPSAPLRALTEQQQHDKCMERAGQLHAEACRLLNMPNLLDDDQVDRLVEAAAMPPVIYDGPVYVCSD